MGASVHPYRMIVADCLKQPCHFGVVYLRIPLLIFMHSHPSTVTFLPLAIVSLSSTKHTVLFRLTHS